MFNYVKVRHKFSTSSADAFVFHVPSTKESQVGVIWVSSDHPRAPMYALAFHWTLDNRKLQVPGKFIKKHYSSVYAVPASLFCLICL